MTIMAWLDHNAVWFSVGWLVSWLCSIALTITLHRSFNADIRRVAYTLKPVLYAISAACFNLSVTPNIVYALTKWFTGA